MVNVDQDLTKLKLEISQGWRLLFRHKWRRPTWIRFPRSVIGDIRWIRLSDRAKAAWPIMLILASEDESARLPNAEIVYRRLREVGLSPRKDSFSLLIDEYIQGGFILKTSPEYRVQSTDYRKKDKRESPASEALNGFASPAPEEKRLGEEARDENPAPLAQPKRPYSKPGALSLVPTSEVMEILGIVPRPAPTPITTPNHLTYAEAMAQSSGPPAGRFEKTRHNRWEVG